MPPITRNRFQPLHFLEMPFVTKKEFFEIVVQKPGNYTKKDNTHRQGIKNRHQVPAKIGGEKLLPNVYTIREKPNFTITRVSSKLLKKFAPLRFSRMM
jgi:hypothetical protein